MNNFLNQLDRLQDAITNNHFIAGIVAGAVLTSIILAYSHIRWIKKNHRNDDDERGLGI